MEDDNSKADRDRRGIQSVEVGGQLLLALVHSGRPMALKDLAREAGMPPAKAHPYLVSFGKLGLIEQDAATGRYGLGPLALQLGLISLQQADPVRIATTLLGELAQRIGHTVAIAVWGSRGPTIVRTEEAPSAVHVTMRHGTVVSMADTASGRLFAAYRPAAAVQALLEEERQRGGAQGRSTPTLPAWEDFERQLVEVRAEGLSRSEGAVTEGVSALSAPVFDHTGAMVLALIAIGPSRALDARPEGATAQTLKDGARAISARLGATGWPAAR